MPSAPSKTENIENNDNGKETFGDSQLFVEKDLPGSSDKLNQSLLNYFERTRKWCGFPELDESQLLAHFSNGDEKYGPG